MKMLRYRIGRLVVHAGLRIMPPSRARSELFTLIDLWSTHVRLTIERARKEGPAGRSGTR